MTAERRVSQRPIPLWNQMVMVLIHLVEVVLVKTNTFALFYRLVPKPYEWFRPWSAFADDLFVGTLRKADKVLEVGSGTGYLLRKAIGEKRRCVGLEPSEEMLRFAEEKAPKALFVRGDMTRLPFKPASFDCCWSMGSILYVDPEEALRQVHEVLVDGGTFAVLLERCIFPVCFPWFRSAYLREAFEKTGFVPAEEVRIGHLYVWFKLVKAPLSQ